MATKNILSYLVLMTLVLSLGACESFNLKTRKEIQDTQSAVGGKVPVEPDIKAEAPAFLQKEAPKLGIILGGGGVLTYAQIGFLQELENQKIPVHGIAGVEWGALVAGAYGLEKKAHAIEWKLLKLPVNNFDQSSFFNSKKGGVKVTTFDSFLTQVFKESDFSDLEIPFTCSYINVAKEKTFLHKTGRIRNAVRSCWPAAPHFQTDMIGANLLGINEMATYLRSEGADIIVYVDVISKNALLPKKQRMADSAMTLNWLALKSLPPTLSRPLVDEVITLSLSGDHMTSYKSLRSIIRKGQIKSKSIVKELAKKYAY